MSLWQIKLGFLSHPNLRALLGPITLLPTVPVKDDQLGKVFLERSPKDELCDNYRQIDHFLVAEDSPCEL